MRITRVLLDDHRIIEQALNCLERMAEHCESRRRLERHPARDAITFLRDFIEHCHDPKVESGLLPAMQAMGVPAERCLECPLRQSREDARIHLDAMDAAIEPACVGETAALDGFAKHARAYIDVLLDCIARNEDCLFPLVEKTARATGSLRLLETADRECDNHGSWLRHVELASRVAQLLGVPEVVVARPDEARDETDRRCPGDNAWPNANRLNVNHGRMM